MDACGRKRRGGDAAVETQTRGQNEAAIPEYVWRLPPALGGYSVRPCVKRKARPPC